MRTSRAAERIRLYRTGQREFASVRLHEVVLANAGLRVDLTAADLLHAKMEGTHLERANLAGAVIRDGETRP